jgi:glycosyltransferase involved in cell wall biosynthesis
MERAQSGHSNRRATEVVSVSDTAFTVNCSRTTLQGGLKTFTDELILALLEEKLRFNAVVPAGFAVPPGAATVSTPRSLAGSSNLSLLRPIRWLLYSRFRFPVPANARVLSTTHHVLPGRRNQIVTVHDLRPFFYPDTPVQAFYFRQLLPRALQRCDAVLTVSDTSRHLISEIYRVPPERIWVVPNVIAPPQEAQGAAHQGQSYLLMVGASWPHKNVEALLRQKALWSERFRLVVVAGKGQYRTRMEELSRQLGIAGRVDFRSGVSPQELEALYAGCAALVTPSRMEGFGLPALEAMARGRPVLAADIPVYRELYGPHATYVSTEDARSWEAAFAALESSPHQNLEAARKHALSFNRDRMRAGVREALRSIWSI